MNIKRLYQYLTLSNNSKVEKLGDLRLWTRKINFAQKTASAAEKHPRGNIQVCRKQSTRKSFFDVPLLLIKFLSVKD